MKALLTSLIHIPMYIYQQYTNGREVISMSGVEALPFPGYGSRPLTHHSNGPVRPRVQCHVPQQGVGGRRRAEGHPFLYSGTGKGQNMGEKGQRTKKGRVVLPSLQRELQNKRTIIIIWHMHSL